MDSLKNFMVFASRNAYLLKNYNMCMQACRIHFPNGGICIHRCRIHSNTDCIGIQECRIRCKNSGICIQGYSMYQKTKIFMSNTYHVWPMSGYTILDFCLVVMLTSTRISRAWRGKRFLSWDIILVSSGPCIGLTPSSWRHPGSLGNKAVNLFISNCGCCGQPHHPTS